MKKLTISTILLFTSIIGFAQSIAFNQQLFDEWVKMRVGDGKKPAIWYCYGEVYSYPDGKLISKMEGIDNAKLIRISKDSVIQLNRKIFVYTDPTTGKVLEEVNGKPVPPIAYTYQMITYVLRGDRMVSYVQQGKAPNITKMGPGYGITARKLSGNTMFSTPVFLNFETPRGKYEAYENYDFLISGDAKNPKDKYQLFWNRYGDNPAFAGGGKGVIQLVSYRLDNFEDIPDNLKNYIKEKKPLWVNPPKDMAEIAEMQK